MGDLQRVDDWLAALLANLEPAARSRMMRQLAQELRRSQQQNIRLQRNPDGSGYEPRRVKAAAILRLTALRKEADSVIAPLKDASEGGYIDETDKPTLTEWQKYRYSLTKVDPENPIYPDKPL